MNKLDPKEIVRNAIDGLTYSKAYDLFSSKKVTLSCHRNELNQDVYDGVVTGKSNKSYPVRAIIDENGKVVEATCKCDYYLTYPGYCKHILAFLLQINEITNKKETSVLTSVLSFYKKSVSLNIDLMPIFYSHKYDTGIELKIGRENKYYYVKNIPELFDNINNNYYFKYGKDLEFMHTMSAFNPKSKSLLEDLYDYINFYEHDSKNYFDGKRKCKIPKIIFKKILDMYLNEEVEFVFDEAHFNLLYTNEACNIRLIFKDGILSIEDRDKMKLFSIGRNFFAMKDGKLYCIDNVIKPNIIPLLNTLYIRPIEFNTRLYNEFFTYIYPKIKDDIEIINSEELLKFNNCSTLETNCYLDLENGVLSLRYDFLYEGMERNEAINKGIFPNTAMEENFAEQLNYFNFTKTTNKNEYILDSLDAALEFLLIDIDALKEIANVYVSDTIKNLRYKKADKAPVGIRYANNWIELIFDNSLCNINELQEILKSLKNKKKYHLLKDGTILNIQDNYFKDLESVLESTGIDSSKLSEKMQIPMFKILQLEHLFDQKEIPHEAVKFLHDLRNFKTINYPIDKSLVNVLRDYQKEGDRWLFNLAYYKIGGILADDMGLGKTLEIITLIKSCKTKYPNIIVSPASLTYNWYNEFKKWTPSLNVLLITGNGQKREELIKSINPGQTIITSYDYLKRDIELYKSMNFHFIIIDEAQSIKNYATKNAETVKEIKAVSHFALTGTPIENSLADLWSIFDFCLPGYLKSYEQFKYEYEYNIIKNHDNAALEKLSKQISPFILRRTKKDVLRELPAKFEQVIYSFMSEEQEKVYNATLLQARDKIIQTNGENKLYIFSMLTRLRQICCHPKLYIDEYSYDSAKLNLTMNIVDEAIDGNHRILIFSQFTSMLNILHKELENKQIKHFILTGNTPSEERFKLVDEFNSNNEIKVFLISLKAGGTGLNLVGADTVIHYDPWWNFSAESQASDRVHRIGQKNNVQIIKVITKNSIEEKILELQEKKKDLFNKVVSDDINILSKLTNEELLSLFSIESNE